MQRPKATQRSDCIPTSSGSSVRRQQPQQSSFRSRRNLERSAAIVASDTQSLSASTSNCERAPKFVGRLLSLVQPRKRRKRKLVGSGGSCESCEPQRLSCRSPAQSSESRIAAPRRSILVGAAGCPSPTYLADDDSGTARLGRLNAVLWIQHGSSSRLSIARRCARHCARPRRCPDTAPPIDASGPSMSTGSWGGWP